MSDVTTTDLDSATQVDAELRGHRETTSAGLHGSTGYLRETLRLARRGSLVMLTVITTGDLKGNVSTVASVNSEAAEVAFLNEAEALRRDGWQLRERDPWEVFSPLDSDDIPF